VFGLLGGPYRVVFVPELGAHYIELTNVGLADSNLRLVPCDGGVDLTDSRNKVSVAVLNELTRAAWLA